MDQETLERNLQSQSPLTMININKRSQSQAVHSGLQQLEPMKNLKQMKGQSNKQLGQSVHEQYQLQDIQLKEFVFGIQNEKQILMMLNEVICFHMYELNPGQVDQSGGLTLKENQNSKYFAQVSLQIINILLDKVPKSQLSENEETYIDLIGNFMFKSKANDVYGLMGLDKKIPIAMGLEPTLFIHDS